MADTDTITPALTPDQWAALREYTRRMYRADDDTWLFDAYVANSSDSPTYRANSWDDNAVAMALANASLPVDDPRKITRENVRYVLAASDLLLGDSRLRDIAGKLAALLPPE